LDLQSFIVGNSRYIGKLKCHLNSGILWIVKEDINMVNSKGKVIANERLQAHAWIPNSGNYANSGHGGAASL
jgi:hypothetical protein